MIRILVILMLAAGVCFGQELRNNHCNLEVYEQGPFDCWEPFVNQPGGFENFSVSSTPFPGSSNTIVNWPGISTDLSTINGSVRYYRELPTQCPTNNCAYEGGYAACSLVGCRRYARLRNNSQVGSSLPIPWTGPFNEGGSGADRLSFLTSNIKRRSAPECPGCCQENFEIGKQYITQIAVTGCTGGVRFTIQNRSQPGNQPEEVVLDTILSSVGGFDWTLHEITWTYNSPYLYFGNPVGVTMVVSSNCGTFQNSYIDGIKTYYLGDAKVDHSLELKQLRWEPIYVQGVETKLKIWDAERSYVYEGEGTNFSQVVNDVQQQLIKIKEWVRYCAP